MALDRFITFPKGKKPKKKQIELVVRNFFGEAATIEWDQDRWTVSLPGKPTWTFEGIEPDMIARVRNTERWIEVYPTGTLDIITRRADEYTNTLAQGLAEVFARYWEGELDDGS